MIDLLIYGGVGAVGMAVGVVWEAWRARPNPDPELPELRLIALPDGRIVASLSDELLAKVVASIEEVVTDQWADEEARALEAAEEILRGDQP
jgi:hypothetical protein